jgi:hypothetical protein
MLLRIRDVVIFILISFVGTAKSQPLYPVINEAAQRVRDNDRRFILETELIAERAALAKSQAVFDADPTNEKKSDVHRHVENVKALERELENTARKWAGGRARVTVKATRPAISRGGANNRNTASFWDPYNRAPDHIDSSINREREMP